MDILDLLQQMGLNKYEAQAYTALVAGGPMTGYELGKRSEVPLSRSYEVLERLRQKGLALVQPGNVPRYRAEEPQWLLARFHSDFESTIDALSSLLLSLASAASASAASTSHDIWVVSGRQNVLARITSMVEEAQHDIALALPGTYHSQARQAVEGARTRGCSVVQLPIGSLTAGGKRTPSLSSGPTADVVLLVTDDRYVLAGTMSSLIDPLDSSQAVVTSNDALVLVVSNWFAGSRRYHDANLSSGQVAPLAGEDKASSVDWLAWEERKHRRLLALGTGGRVA